MTTPETAMPEVRLNGVALVAAEGELDLATAEAVRARLIEIVDGGCTRMVLDLAELSFCDSQGLTALVGAAEHAKAAGGSVTLTGTSPLLAKLLRITGLDQNFSSYC